MDTSCSFLPSFLVDPPGFELLEVQQEDMVTRSDDGATRTTYEWDDEG